jgi:hypothetical protein
MQGGELFGIECIAGGERVVVRADAIEQIVEYAVSPLPLARPEIAGLAFVGEELVLSVTISGGAARREADRATKAVLFTTRRDGVARWALEIDDVLSFVRVKREDGEGRAAWLPKAKTTDGRPVLLVDVTSMIAALGGEEASR